MQKAERGTFIAFKDNPNYKKIIKKDSFVRKFEEIFYLANFFSFVLSGIIIHATIVWTLRNVKKHRKCMNRN